MDQTQKKETNYITIDLVRIFRAIWHKLWLVIIIGVLAAAVAFAYSSFVITPNYSSSILLYVNNSSINLGNTSFSISASDISASQSLVKTYTELLKNRTTLERVIEKADVDYTYEQMYDMIEAGSSNGTQIMRVTVTGTDPYEASKIANTIAEILPERITEIIDGASMEVVDSAIPVPKKVSPSITKYTAVGLVIGVLIACAGISVGVITDDTIRDEEYVIQTYNYPILAKVPDLLNTDSRGYAYYKRPSTAQKR